MKHFNKKRELIEGDPAELWDDIEYMASMDNALYYVLNPEKSEFPDAAQRQQRWWKNGTIFSPRQIHR